MFNVAFKPLSSSFRQMKTVRWSYVFFWLKIRALLEDQSKKEDFFITQSTVLSVSFSLERTKDENKMSCVGLI